MFFFHIVRKTRIREERRFKGKTEKKGGATGRERRREREGWSVGGEESENRSLVSPLLYFIVALLPAGDIQEMPPNRTHMNK